MFASTKLQLQNNFLSMQQHIHLIKRTNSETNRDSVIQKCNLRSLFDATLKV